jgi:hypothetical protein
MHGYMGYNFKVHSVASSNSTLPGEVDVTVIVEQRGVAPFYL